MADVVVPHGEHRVVEVGAPAAQSVKGPAIHGNNGALRPVDMLRILRPFPADESQIAARDHRALCIDYAHHPVRGILDLQNDVLKNPS